MNFQTTSGVFDAPAQPQHSQPAGPDIQAQSFVPRKLPALPCAPADLICSCLLIAEIILLFVFSDALFYGVILPALSLLMDISGLAIFLIVVGVAISKGCRKIFRRHRGRRWF